MSTFNALPLPLKLNVRETAPNYWFLVQTTQLVRLIELISRFHSIVKDEKQKFSLHFTTIVDEMNLLDQFWTASLAQFVDKSRSLERVAATAKLLSDVMLLTENRKAIQSDAKAMLDVFQEFQQLGSNVPETRKRGVSKDVARIIVSIDAVISATFGMLKNPVATVMRPLFVNYVAAFGRCMCYAIAGNKKDAATQHSRLAIAAIAIAREMDAQVAKFSSGSMQKPTGQYGFVPSDRAPVKYEQLPPTTKGVADSLESSYDGSEFAPVEARPIIMKSVGTAKGGDLQKDVTDFLKLAGDRVGEFIMSESRKILPLNGVKRLAILLPPRSEFAKSRLSAAVVLYHVCNDSDIQGFRKLCLDADDVYAADPDRAIKTLAGAALTLNCIPWAVALGTVTPGYTTDGRLFSDDFVNQSTKQNGELVRVPGVSVQIVAYRVKRLLRLPPSAANK